MATIHCYEQHSPNHSYCSCPTAVWINFGFGTAMHFTIHCGIPNTCNNTFPATTWMWTYNVLYYSCSQYLLPTDMTTTRFGYISTWKCSLANTICQRILLYNEFIVYGVRNIVQPSRTLLTYCNCEYILVYCK